MAIAPTAIWDVWYRVRDLYNGPGLQDEELAGIVGDRLHSFGFHLAPNELPASDYSLQTARDRAGARANPGDASALDIHFGPAGMVKVTNRLIAAAKADDPRMHCLYEFCGTTNGRTPHPFTVDGKVDDPNNTQGWDDSHVTHVHLSFHRDVCTNFEAIKGVADVIAGVSSNPDEREEMALSPEAVAQIRAELTDFLHGKDHKPYGIESLEREALADVIAEVATIKADVAAIRKHVGA